MKQNKKIQFKDLSGWLKLAVVYVYVEIAMAALFILILLIIGASLMLF